MHHSVVSVLMSLQVSLDGQEASSREQVSLCVCCKLAFIGYSGFQTSWFFPSCQPWLSMYHTEGLGMRLVVG